MLIICPNVPTIDEERTGNRIRQIGELAPRFEGALATFNRGRLQGFLFRPADGDDVLILPRAGRFRTATPKYFTPPLMLKPTVSTCRTERG